MRHQRLFVMSHDGLGSDSRGRHHGHVLLDVLLGCRSRLEERNLLMKVKTFSKKSDSTYSIYMRTRLFLLSTCLSGLLMHVALRSVYPCSCAVVACVYLLAKHKRPLVRNGDRNTGAIFPVPLAFPVPFPFKKKKTNLNRNQKKKANS